MGTKNIQAKQNTRKIIHLTRGSSSKPIARLVSPSDLGALIKPFVFLDIFDFNGENTPMSMEHGWHPHSGIATVTVVLDGSIQYAETTGNTGVLPAGSIEWMQSGKGVWHTGAHNSGRVRGFQLWVALPPELENADNGSHYVMPEDVPTEGPVQVILGSYGQATSLITSPPMNYFVVKLKAGEHWSYQPPKEHTVAWVAVMDGAIETSAPIAAGEIAIFASSEKLIDFVAEDDTRFVLGSSAKHPHELVLGNYSVHTSTKALRRGEEEIRRIGQELHAQGKRSYALKGY